MYQEGKVNSQSVAFSHKVCRDNIAKNYSFMAEIMSTVIKKVLIFPLFPSLICLILVQIVVFVNQIIKITRACYQTLEVGVAFLHLQQGRDNNIIIGVVGVSLIQGHGGSRGGPA